MRNTEQLGYDDISDMFPTDEHVYDWLEKERWGGHPKCPRCAAGEPYRRTGDPRQMICRRRRKEFNVKTGSIFQGTRVRVRAWFRSAAQLLISKMGISSREIGAFFRLGQGMAWSLPRKIREGFKFRGGPMKGVARIGETYVGGLEKTSMPTRRPRAARAGSLKTRIAVAGLYEESEPQAESQEAKLNLADAPAPRALTYAKFTLDGGKLDITCSVPSLRRLMPPDRCLLF